MNPSKDIINQKIAEYMGWKFIDWDNESHEHISGSSLLDETSGTMYKGHWFTDSLDALVPVWEKLDMYKPMDLHMAGKHNEAYWRQNGINYHHASSGTIQHAAALATYKAIIAMEKEGE